MSSACRRVEHFCENQPRDANKSLAEESETRLLSNLRGLFVTVAFVITSSIPIVVSSEKSFWYPQGFEVFGLAVFYSSAVIFGLWAIQAFHVRRFAPLFLCGALFGILVEGVITPLVYEAGPFDPVLVVWTSIAWHATLSFVLCWYLFRKWLIRREVRKLAIACAFYGLFLGFWSLSYYLPEVIFIGELHSEALGEELVEEFESIAEEGGDVQAFLTRLSPQKRMLIEEALKSHIWPPQKYMLWALVVTLWLAGAHYILGWLWPKDFRPGKALLGLALIVLLLFAFIWLPSILWAPAKLAVILTVILLPLRKNMTQEQNPTVFEELHGKVNPRHLISFLLVPTSASIIYWSHTINPFTEGFIRTWSYEGIKLILIIVGAGMFVWSVYRTLRPTEEISRTKTRPTTG